MKRQYILLLSLVFAISFTASAEPNIWKEIKKAGKEIINGAGSDLENTGKGLLNEAVSGLIGGGKDSGNSNRSTTTTSSGRTNSTTQSTSRSNSSANRSVTMPKAIGSGLIRNIIFDNAGLNEPFFRFGRDLMLDNTGFCYKGKISVAIPNQQGKRLFCFVEPLINGNTAQDQNGQCSAIIAFDVTSANYVADVPFAIPTGWCGIEMNSKLTEPKPFVLALSIVDFSIDEPLLYSTEVTIDGSRIFLDHERFIQGAAGSIFGGSGSGGIGEALLTGMFGGGDTVTHTCGSCDGTGLCPYCDGMGYINPSSCRKCSSNPGICRRCNGSGQETAEVELNSVW